MGGWVSGWVGGGRKKGLTLHIRQRAHNGAAGGLGDSFQVFFFHPADGDGPGFHEVLEGQVVDACWGGWEGGVGER